MGAHQSGVITGTAERNGLAGARERLERSRADLHARVEVLEAEQASLRAEATALSAEGERLGTASQAELKAREAAAVRLGAERDAAQAQYQTLLTRIGKAP